ncbi:MAG: hypothetical protein FJ027_16750 [Candidatus Rokubacteria bacterium]|nr:hypothetical protein [Candidatus Rokubacteria bacterium]
MSVFEADVTAELEALVHAGVPARGVRIAVRERMVVRLERGALGPREVREAMAVMVRAACRLVRERGAPPELVELVCGAALEAVRGHGGETARWLAEAMATADAVLAAERGH